MIGLFLALLELIRQRRIRVGQERPFGEIVIYLLDDTPLDREMVAEETATARAATEGDSASLQPGDPPASWEVHGQANAGRADEASDDASADAVPVADTSGPSVLELDDAAQQTTRGVEHHAS